MFRVNALFADLDRRQTQFIDEITVEILKTLDLEEKQLTLGGMPFNVDLVKVDPSDRRVTLVLSPKYIEVEKDDQKA